MSAAAEETQKTKKQCVVFEPQAWRKTLCRNCFKTRNEHNSSSDADDQQKPTSPVISDGDAIILRREGTPAKDSFRSGTPTSNSTPATSPTATSAGKNILLPDQDTTKLVGKENHSAAINDASSDKGNDKADSKSCSNVDKNSRLSKASAATTADKVQTKSEITNVTVNKDESEKAVTARENCKKSNNSKTSTVKKQCADSKSAVAQQSTTPALSHSVENNESSNVVDIQGRAAHEAPTTSATGTDAGGEAVTSSADIKSLDEVDAQASVCLAVQPQREDETSPAEPSHHDNISSPDARLTTVWQNDTETVSDASGPRVNTRGSASDEDGSSSTTITRCTDDATVSGVAAAAAAASVANSRSSETSDEIIGDEARSAEAGRADHTKIDHGSGERSPVVAADGMVATALGASLKANTGLGEDSQPVHQLDPTPDQRVDVCATDIPGVQSGLFTKDDVSSDAASSSSISLTTAADDTRGAFVEQQSPHQLVDVNAAAGHDFAPEVTSRDTAAGHTKVEATITLSDLSLPYVGDNSRPIHIVSVAGISGYQRGGSGGVWTCDASQNVENFVVGAERGRLPPDYDQSAGYSSSSVSDDEYAATSPLVDYLSRSPLARSLHGATERSPDTEIVATGGGGETSLFHHVPADSDQSTTAAGVSNDTQDWEADGCAVRLAASSETDNRLIHTYIYDHFSAIIITGVTLYYCTALEVCFTT